MHSFHNIQCIPTPALWVASGAVVPPTPSVAITDDAGNALLDDAGGEIEYDS